MSNRTNEKPLAALRRLLRIARGGTGQSRHVANFLLAWWNAETCGGFDLTTAWACDDEIVRDMVLVFVFAATARYYPDSLGFESEFADVIRLWRPELSK